MLPYESLLLYCLFSFTDIIYYKITRTLLTFLRSSVRGRIYHAHTHALLPPLTASAHIRDLVKTSLFCVIDSIREIILFDSGSTDSKYVLTAKLNPFAVKLSEKG